MYSAWEPWRTRCCEAFEALPQGLAAQAPPPQQSLQRRLEASERALEAETATKRRQEAEIRYLKQDLARAQESSARHAQLWSEGEVALARMQRRQDDLLRQVLALQNEDGAGLAQSAVYNQEVMERFFRSTNQQRAIDTMTAITFRRRALTFRCGAGILEATSPRSCHSLQRCRNHTIHYPHV